MIPIFDIIAVLKSLPGSIRWLRYRKLIQVIRHLNDDEKHILRGLSGSPTPLEIYQAIKQSTGSELTSTQLGNYNTYGNNLIEKKLIIERNSRFIISEGAEYAISKGALKHK